MRSITIKTLFIALTAFSFSAFGVINQAQSQHFEGSITYEMDTSDENDPFTLFVKENRLRISGQVPAAAADFPITGESVLIRADHGDMLIQMDDKQAVQIKFAELESMLNMFMQPKEREEMEDEVREELKQAAAQLDVRETSETRSIHGYTAVKTIIYDAEKPDSELHLWMSDDLFIDWDKMVSTMGGLTKTLGLDQMLESYGWKGQKTPLLVEAYEKGELDFRLKATQISPRSLTKAEIDVADGVQVVSLFQAMMQSGQRR